MIIAELNTSKMIQTNSGSRLCFDLESLTVSFGTVILRQKWADKAGEAEAVADIVNIESETEASIGLSFTYKLRID